MTTALKHVTTDPRCARHRTPLNPFTRWWFDRRRGLTCWVCALKTGRAQAGLTKGPTP